MTQSPFPGMDPYLEAPDTWPSVHFLLMAVFVEELNPLLRPDYYADINTRIVVDRVWDDPPEVEVLPDLAIVGRGSETPVGIRSLPLIQAPIQLATPSTEPTRLITLYIKKRPSHEIVTVIELLSPINKRPGDYRRDYLEKRMDYLESRVHLVEIDLLRRWPRMPLEGVLPPCDYLATVSKSYERPTCDVWPIRLHDPLPVLPIPLLKSDPAVPLDLGKALRTVYERGEYDLRVDYDQKPDPPLSKADAAWAANLLREAKANQ
jgi:hypothetical protein